MISKNTIKEFICKEYEGWDWLKTLTKSQLIQEIEFYKSKVPSFEFKTIPYTHQLAAFLIGIYNDEFLFLLDMGTGKTKIVIDILTFKKKLGKINKKILFLVPYPINVESCITEVNTHSNFTANGLKGSSVEKWEQLQSAKEDIIVLNYDGLIAMLCNKVTRKSKSTSKSINKMKMEPVSKKVDIFCSYFSAVVFDECHFMKNRISLTFRVCNLLSSICKIRYGLTGTPFGRNPEDLWSQFYLIDKGKTLGEYITIFREAFFSTKVNYFGGYEYKFLSKYEDNLNRRIKNKSIRYSETEVNDLPSCVHNILEFNLDEEARTLYRQALNGLIESKGNLIEIDNYYTKTRQISSGFMYFKTEEGLKEEIVFLDNPKLELLMSIISSTNEDEKMVIFNEFIKSGDIIEERLKKEKIKYVRAYSGTKDKTKELNKFLHQPKYKILLANSQSVGIGLNLQIARYVVFYESPVSPIERKQAEKRCHRTGQTRTVFMYDLVAKNSIDKIVLQNLQQGKDLFKAILEELK